MESSFNLQLRLQHLVEALSVIAASYYAVGLIAFILRGAKAFPDWTSIDLLLAVITPVVMLGIFALVSLLRRRYLGETSDGFAAILNLTIVRLNGPFSKTAT